MMTRSVLALPYLLPMGAVELGDVVANRDLPTQRIYTSPTLIIPDSNVLITPGSDAKDLQQYDKGAGLSILLSRIFKTEFSADSRKDLSLDTKQVYTGELKNSDDIFTRICEKKDFQTWLEKTSKKTDAYFVIGLQVITDAGLEIKTNVTGKAAAGMNPPTGQTGVDVAFEGHAQTTKARGSQITAGGEQIYAIEYRRIGFDRFTEKNAANAHLKPQQTWVSTLKTRDHEDDQPPIIQVSLLDDKLEDGFEVVSSSEDTTVYASSSTLKQ